MLMEGKTNLSGHKLVKKWMTCFGNIEMIRLKENLKIALLSTFRIQHCFSSLIKEVG